MQSVQNEDFGPFWWFIQMRATAVLFHYLHVYVVANWCRAIANKNPWNFFYHDGAIAILHIDSARITNLRDFGNKSSGWEMAGEMKSESDFKTRGTPNSELR